MGDKMKDLKASTILFIGAGASEPIGFPTTKSAMERLGLEPYYEPEKIEKVTSHGKLLESIYTGLSKEKKDLEGILEYIRHINYVLSQSNFFEKELEKAIQGFDIKKIKFLGHTYLDDMDVKTLKREYIDLVKKSFENYENATEALEKDITNYLFELYRYIPDKHDIGILTYYKPLMLLADSIFSGNADDIPIFTTNYDLVIENLISLDFMENYEFIDGFVYERRDRQLVFSLSEFERAFDKPVIKLFKLHGGLDWAVRKKGDKLIRVEKVESIIDEKEVKYKAPVIVPPGEHGQPYSRDEFFKLHDCLKKYLRNAERCIVIGFSFRDFGRINRIFYDALKRNKKLKILISSRTEKFEDFKKKVEDDFRDTINKFEGRFTYYGGGFKTLPEKLKKV